MKDAEVALLDKLIELTKKSGEEDDEKR